MKGTLILSGGGSMEQTRRLDEIYFSMLSRNATILYIPIALKRDRLGFEACYDWFSRLVCSHANTKDIDFSMILDGDIVPDLTSFDSVYIGGGNTFKLLQFLEENRLSSKLVHYVQRGGIAYGGSAGAIIFGKDIQSVEEENDKNYSYTKGLNLLKNHSVICHYEASRDHEIFQKTTNVGHVMALPEGSGLIVTKDQILTNGSVIHFDKKEKNIVSEKTIKHFLNDSKS